jgi:hypothetical protein
MKTVRMCEHDKRRSDCKICSPHNYCFTHNMHKRHCGRCGTHTSICVHKRRKVRCVECAREGGVYKPGSVCEHNVRRYQCALCVKGSLLRTDERSEICACGIRKRFCTEHGGSFLCVDCRVVQVAKVGGLCSACAPPESNPRIKKKELEVRGWLLGDAESITTAGLPRYSAHNKSLERTLRQYYGVRALCLPPGSQTATYFPDFYWVLPDKHVILEVDEHQHRPTRYPTARNCYEKDTQRENDLVDRIASVAGKPVVFVRYNPDAFETGFKRRGQYLPAHTSKECRKRLLLETLRRVISTDTVCQVHFVRICFDCSCASLQGCGFCHEEFFDSVVAFRDRGCRAQPTPVGGPKKGKGVHERIDNRGKRGERENNV